MIEFLNWDRVLEINGHPDSGRIAHSFFGTLDIDGKDVHCCIKAYRKDLVVPSGNGSKVRKQDKSIFNEIMGYCLAKLTGFNVPEKAGLVRIKRNMLNDPPDWIDAEEWTCFFSSLVAYPDLNRAYTTNGDFNNRGLIKRLRESPKAAAISQFDEWTLNTDRNTGNLLEIGNGDFYLIDHGRIFHCEFWGSSDFKYNVERKNAKNILLELIGEEVTSKLDFKHRRMVAHQNISNSFTIRSDEFAKILAMLFRDNPEIYQLIFDFMQKRADIDFGRRNIGLLC